MHLNIITVPAFCDNYLWLFHYHNDKRAYVVDPGDAKPIQAELKHHGLTLAGILITHHHPDHTGGIDDLLTQYPVPVYGPAGGSVPQVTKPMRDGDALQLENGLTFSVLAVPGHTLDHLAYFTAPANDEPLVFCGDTLFAGGCGRLFEGSAQQMHTSLQKLAQLPGNTRVYCAHEYTLSNLAFAQAVEPENSALQTRIARETERRQHNIPTIPSSIAVELDTNPFMRSHTSPVKHSAETRAQATLGEAHEVLAVIRKWKDSF